MWPFESSDTPYQLMTDDTHSINRVTASTDQAPIQHIAVEMPRPPSIQLPQTQFYREQSPCIFWPRKTGFVVAGLIVATMAALAYFGRCGFSGNTHCSLAPLGSAASLVFSVISGALLVEGCCISEEEENEIQPDLSAQFRVN
jgi:hypothetical protein